MLTANGRVKAIPTWVHYLVALGAVAALTAGLWRYSQSSPYQPGLSPVAGYSLWNATQPRGLAAGYIKGLQNFFEITPCEYKIMGWDAGGAFYYQALCEGQLQLWTARPEERDSVRRIGQLPADVVDWPLSKNDVFPLVRVTSTWPASTEPYTRRLKIHSQPYPSPDGAWMAFVVKDVFGPQDVVVIGN